MEVFFLLAAFAILAIAILLVRRDPVLQFRILSLTDAVSFITVAVLLGVVYCLLCLVALMWLFLAALFFFVGAVLSNLLIVSNFLRANVDPQLSLKDRVTGLLEAWQQARDSWRQFAEKTREEWKIFF